MLSPAAGRVGDSYLMQAPNGTTARRMASTALPTGFALICWCFAAAIQGGSDHGRPWFPRWFGASCRLTAASTAATASGFPSNTTSTMRRMNGPNSMPPLSEFSSRFAFKGMFHDMPSGAPARAAFHGTARTKRADFGMTRDNLVELGVPPAPGADVEIDIDIEADANSPRK